MIYLAPLQGYTDFIYRNAYSKYYECIDVAVSPFIPMAKGKNGILRIAKDVLPENNHTMPVIPQLIGNNAEHFIQMVSILNDWGYNIINWNLGCPIKNITKKKRGSGLLPFPELVNEILEKVIPHIPQKLSIKLRLGLNDTNDIFQLIPILNDYPLENIIIHPRTASQMYEGEIHHNVMQKCIPLIKHKIIYNGDIFNLNDFQNIQKIYPEMKTWMIGRGVLLNPLLPSLIKEKQNLSDEKQNEIFLNFILEIYHQLKIHKTEKQLMNKIKDYWKFFSKRFLESEKIFEIISHTHSFNEVNDITKKIFNEENKKDWSI